MRAHESHVELLASPAFVHQRIPEPATKPKDYMREQLPLMAKWEIEELRSEIKQHYLSRFKRPRIAKYGTLNKGFEEQELRVFLAHIDNEKHRLLFEFMANLGLRVGEAVRVNIKDIKPESRELIVYTEKARQPDSLRIPLPLFKETLDFIHAHTQEIEQHEGYIFFKDFKYSKHGCNHLDLNYVRNIFREYITDAGLDETYDVSEERNSRTPRRLHRLTTHSLRHYAITRFARSTNGNVVLTAHFARHRNPSTTNTYIALDKKELYDVIDAISVNEAILLKKKISEEKI